MTDRALESELTPVTASTLPAARRVLVFAPHADDEVFGCGGTLHLLAKAGAMITVIVATDGALGGIAGERETTALIAARDAEAKAGVAQAQRQIRILVEHEVIRVEKSTRS